MNYTNACERSVQDGLAKLKRLGEIQLIEPGGGRRRSSLYRISIFDDDRSKEVANPAELTGINSRENPAILDGNPENYAPNPAKSAPKRKERKKRKPITGEPFPCACIPANKLNELLLQLNGAKWRPWATNLIGVRTLDKTAIAFISGEFARTRIESEFGGVILAAVRHLREEIEDVRFSSTKVEFN